MQVKVGGCGGVFLGGGPHFMKGTNNYRGHYIVLGFHYGTDRVHNLNWNVDLLLV